MIRSVKVGLDRRTIFLDLVSITCLLKPRVMGLALPPEFQSDCSALALASDFINLTHQA